MSEAWDDFDTAATLVAGAATPEDLFGPAGPGGDRAAARREYRRLARLCHPDSHAGARRHAAGATFATLARRWQEWQAAAAGTPAAPAQTFVGDYVLGDVVARTDVADIHAGCPATEPDRPLLVKVVRRPADSDLLANEARVLRHLVAVTHSQWYPYLPHLVDAFRHTDSGDNRRRVNVFVPLAGFVSLADVATAFPAGLDARDAAWMWRRLLVALGVAHQAGVVHGAVLPDQVLIHPADHGLVLSDWCYATAAGDPLRAMVARYRHRYPDEVEAKEPATPATDIALATGTMAALMGDRVPAPLRRFIDGCTLPRAANRPDDAWRLLAELDQLLERLYGPRRFRPFILPTPSTTPTH